MIWRLDGFNGEIRLTAEGLPKGVTCPPQTVGSGQRFGSLVLTAAPDAPAWTGTISVQGTATIAGKEVVREARPATITWPVPQPNIPTISRLDRTLVLAVPDKAPYSLTAGLDAVTVAAGPTATIPLKIARHW